MYTNIYITVLLVEWKTGDKNDICKNTRAIVFYSTPHRGSHVAALKQATQMLVWPTVEVQELRQGNDTTIYVFTTQLTRSNLSLCDSSFQNRHNCYNCTKSS